MHWQVGASDVLEFGFDLFLGGVDNQRRPLAKDQFFDLDETKKLAMTDLPGIDLVDLPMAHENDLEKLLVTHNRR
jgi:hypothetical protein